MGYVCGAYVTVQAFGMFTEIEWKVLLILQATSSYFVLFWKLCTYRGPVFLRPTLAWGHPIHSVKYFYILKDLFSGQIQ